MHGTFVMRHLEISDMAALASWPIYKPFNKPCAERQPELGYSLIRGPYFMEFQATKHKMPRLPPQQRLS